MSDNQPLYQCIRDFSEYLDKEYEALYPIVQGNDYTRGSSPVDHKVQIELERRLDLVDYIRSLFVTTIESKIEDE